MEAIHPKAAASAIAVLRGARSIREVQTACGFKSPNTAHRWIRHAVEDGLILYDGTPGSLRPAVCCAAWAGKGYR